LHGASNSRRIAADALARGFQASPQRRQLLRTRPSGWVPHVGMASREHQRPVTPRADPDRWMRLLDRLRNAHSVAHSVVTTFEVRARLRPQRPQDLERLAESADAMVQPLDSIHLVLHLRPGGPDAELQATAGEVV